MTIQNEKDKKAMPLEALETLSALTREKRRTKSAEQPQGAPYEAVAGLSEPTCEKPTESSETLSADAELRQSRIVDITGEFVGKAFIITGVRPPEK